MPTTSQGSSTPHSHQRGNNYNASGRSGSGATTTSVTSVSMMPRHIAPVHVT
ncbi:TPA: hypothetical protein ACHGD4_005498 [Escherichia coli]